MYVYIRVHVQCISKVYGNHVHVHVYMHVHVFNTLRIVSYYTSAKIIPLNEWGCRDGMYHAKNHGNKKSP